MAFRRFLSVVPLVAFTTYGQTSILSADSLAAFRLFCPGGQLERVAVPGQPFAEALRLTTPDGNFQNEYDCRIRHALTVPVANGDWLVAVFWIRSLQASNIDGALVKLNFERNAPDYRKSVNSGTLATPEWRRMQIPFRVVEAYQPGGAQLDFWVGYEPQVVEIGGISVTNHGPSSNPPLPALGYTYPGREADAPWRAAAALRIENFRKAAVTVTVKDARGMAAAGAALKLRMKRHAFGFGSAVAADGILGTRPDDDPYRRKIAELFNKVVLENDLKWPGWEQSRSRALDAIAWLRNNGITDIRGHNMVWPAWQYLPRDVQGLAANPAALRKRIDDHILEVGAATRGLVTDCDVVNEPIPNRDIQNILGDYELVRWFQLARAADPGVRLFVNEYDIETGGGRNTRKQLQFLDLLQSLAERDAPANAIGIQGHFGTDLTNPQKVYEILDRFAQLGLPIQITEFDINSTDEQLQADYIRDYMTIVFSHPAVDAFLQWGFWAGRHWLPDAALYRRDWSEKPNGAAYRKLVFEDWWTNAEGVTDKDGAFAARGYRGEYELEVTLGGRSLRRPLIVDGDKEVAVNLE